MTREQQIKALKAIGDAIIETVREAGPMGAPGGTLYAAMMAHGATLDQFETFMSVLVSTGKLRKSGDLYFIAEAK